MPQVQWQCGSSTRAPAAKAAEEEAGADELEALSTAQLREKGKELGVVPVGDKRKAEV
jgi:hypothetical protein